MGPFVGRIPWRLGARKVSHRYRVTRGECLLQAFIKQGIEMLLLSMSLCSGNASQHRQLCFGLRDLLRIIAVEIPLNRLLAQPCKFLGR